MSFSFSKIGTKLSLAKHLMKESQLADDPKSLAAILPLLTGADDSTNYELTANGHGGHVGSLTLRSVGAIVTVLLVLAVTSTAHARYGKCPNCPAAPAIVQPPCDACGDKICRPPENLPPPKPIPAPPVTSKVTAAVVTVIPQATACEPATDSLRPVLTRLRAWRENRIHILPWRRR